MQEKTTLDIFISAAYDAYASALEAHKSELITDDAMFFIGLAYDHSQEAMLCDCAGWQEKVDRHIRCATDCAETGLSHIN